ncbi:MAG: hypothetical protein D6733_01825 [Methanobacteriota archaeon]|nr:MAG: hypothetical protein D6733_01825 [Euryarchaeota archaeon]
MITLTTDFGASEYVGAMKGVIYSINPEAVVVDLSHGIRPFDIRHGAYALYTTFPYFPEGSVHVVVVDPGVGTERRGVIIESEGHLFVGPDNGVFSLIEAEEVYEIKDVSASSTFHGRDVFAPVAARLDGGERPAALGRRTDGVMRIMNKEVDVAYSIHGEVFCRDRFGNVITSIREEHLKEAGLKRGGVPKVIVERRRISAPFVGTYGEIEGEGFGALVNSSGYFEIALREGSAAERLDVRGGESVEVIP